MTAEKKHESEKVSDLVEKIEKLTALELSELVKALEEKFGVSAAAPFMAMAPAVAKGGAAEGEAVEEKTSFSVVLTSVGDSKIQLIKAVRELTGKGLKEAKDLVDALPQVVKEGIVKAEAEELKKKLEEAGATVEIK